MLGLDWRSDHKDGLKLLGSDRRPAPVVIEFKRLQIRYGYTAQTTAIYEVYRYSTFSTVLINKIQVVTPQVDKSPKVI